MKSLVNEERNPDLKGGSYSCYVNADGNQGGSYSCYVNADGNHQVNYSAKTTNTAFSSFCDDAIQEENLDYTSGVTDFWHTKSINCDVLEEDGFYFLSGENKEDTYVNIDNGTVERTFHSSHKISGIYSFVNGKVIKVPVSEKNSRDFKTIGEKTI